MANHRKRMTISEQIEAINEEINAKELELNSLKATQSLSRILNIPRKKICYISPQHLNYFENEEKLHDFFRSIGFQENRAENRKLNYSI